MEELRREIDRIDSELLSLIAKRLEVAKKIGEYKKKNKIPIRDKKRESEIVNKRADAFRQLGHDDKEFIKKLFSLLFKKSRKVQK